METSDTTAGSAVQAVLFFDGACGMCSSGVRWLAGRDGGRLGFAPLEGFTARLLTAGAPYLRELDSALLLEAPGTTQARWSVRSEAIIRALWHCGGIWRLAMAALVVPASWRDAIYDAVARRRHRLAKSMCSLADAGLARRVLP